MPNYQQSKIYKIISPHTDKIYIGSTTKQYISERKSDHKCRYENWKNDNTKGYCSSYELYDLGDIQYILLESYKCNSKDELTARERYWIEQNINNVVNIVKRPYVSELEAKQNKHNYYENNKDHFSELNKIWKKNNKDKLIEYSLIKYDCECGSKNISKCKESRHIKSDKHQTYLMIQTL